MAAVTFDNIFGQDAAIDVLRHAYDAERLPHGLIFAGPAGVGKATTARALATLFLCEKPTRDARPCGKCDGCRGMESGNHPDFHVIFKELIRYHDKTGKSKGIALSIDVVRPELIDPANRKSAMGVGKVFVVEQAELLTAQAQNSLLKTLEEPAGRTLIILLTDQPGSLLPTIRSRCQSVRFGTLDETLVRKELEKRKIDKRDAADTARFAAGSLGIAIKWLEDGVIDAARQLEEKIAQIIAGRTSGDLADWLKKSAEAYAEKQLERDELASKDQANREGLVMYLCLAGQQFRKRLKELDDAQELERACSAIDAIVRAEQYLDSNVNVALALQQLSLSLDREYATSR